MSAVQNLRDFVPVVYDMTVAISKEAPDPTILRILKCQSSVVNIIINLKYNGPWVQNANNSQGKKYREVWSGMFVENSRHACLQVHVHVRRVPMKQLPTTDIEIAAWCREAFHKKVLINVLLVCANDNLVQHHPWHSYVVEDYVMSTSGKSSATPSAILA